jgi:hypothetical protein
MAHRALTVNHARFAHDTVDGETMVIDTSTGQLILLNGIATTLWERLRYGVAADELLAEVRQHYGDDPVSATWAFLQELQGSGLIVEATDAAATKSDQETPATNTDHPAAGSDTRQWPASYVPPAIERIDDIADIMSMDPIHDVDTSRGWPHAHPGTLG